MNSATSQPGLTVASAEALFDLALGEDVKPSSSVGPFGESQDDTGMVIAGRYVLFSMLGEGASGRVWRAEQLTPVRRMVALKITRRGLMTSTVAARFAREYQVQARLEHPHISAVFDAGDLSDGRAFFAMELVEGLPITEWARQQKPTLRQRLEVFVQACQAVQHAHQKGVLHRDLKPSNVLVSFVDGQPRVKVIDFGIAKALSGDLALGRDVTLRGMVLGTPRYMSPEQAGLTGEDVDTRSDVYALGVLLYELLTGSTPLAEAENADSLPLSELLQRVRLLEVQRPSRRIAHTLADSKARELCRALEGDLDWITLQALQKDREKRYPAVSALTEDVLHYLKDEPVSAGPPHAAYWLGKWAKRHRGEILAVMAVLFASVAGIAATWWALGVGEAEKQEAERQRQRARQESEMAGQMSAQLRELLVSSRRHIDAGLNTAILRQLADDYARGMQRFAESPSTEAPLAGQLATLYSALEEPACSIKWFQRHWELLKVTEGPQAYVTLQALYELGWRAVDYSMAEQAVKWLSEAAEGLARLPEARDEALHANKELARALSRCGRYDESVRLFSEVLEQAGESHPKRAIWMRELADALRSGGYVDEALAVLEKAQSHLRPEDVGPRAYVLSAMASLLEMKERWQEALDASNALIQALEKAPGTTHARLVNALMQHATLACKCPGCPGAETAAKRALTLARASGTRLADAWTTWCEVLRVSRRYKDSEAAAREAIAELTNAKVENWRIMELYRRLGDILVSRSDYAAAKEAYQKAADGWFTPPIVGRAPEKERLIFSSFATFWRLAEEAHAPLADVEQRVSWEKKMAEWDVQHAQLLPKP